MNRSHTKSWIVFWIILHIALLVGIFTYRFNLTESIAAREAWSEGNFAKPWGGHPQNYIKLYFSGMVEVYFWEWSQVALGRGLPPEHPWSGHGWQQLGDKNEFLQKKIKEVQKPYVDIPWEYPPLLMAPVLLAGSLSHDFLSFTRLLALQNALAYLFCLYLAYLIWRQIPQEKQTSFTSILALSFFSILCLGQVYVNRLDTFAAVFYLAALYTFLKERWASCALWILLGFLTKAYPIILAPLFLGMLLLKKNYRATATFVGVGLLGLVLAGVVFHLGTAGEGWRSFLYHGERGIQVESLYALLPYWTKLLFKFPIYLNDDHGAWHLTSPVLPWLNRLSSILPVVLFLVFYLYNFIYYRKLWNGSQPKNTVPFLITGSLGLLLLWLVTFKVLSPQFFVWLTPLVFLLPKMHSKIKTNFFWVIYFAVLILTQVLWPNLYSQLERAEILGIILLTIRNLGLVILLGMVWKELGRLAPKP